MSWRRINLILHRDIGYLCVALTLIYAVSGIALNHLSPSFNPNYHIEKSTTKVTPLAQDARPDMQFIEGLLEELQEKGKYKSGAFVSKEVLRIFVEDNTIDVHLETGVVQMEKVNKRPLLFQANALHLNKIKGWWTWLADLYCIALIILALTGALMIRGKQSRRHLLLVLIGGVIPLGFIFML